MGNSDKRGLATILIIIGVTTICMVIGTLAGKYLPNDSPLEQISEEIIKEEIGAEIDFTPEKK